MADMGGFDRKSGMADPVAAKAPVAVDTPAAHQDGPQFYGSGGGSAAALQTALGHWADDHSDRQAAAPNEAQQKMFGDFMNHRATDHLDANGNPVLEFPHTQVAGLMNGLNYDKNWRDHAVPEDTKLDLSSPEGRLKSLDHLTQQYGSGGAGEDTCAASSLVGAAVLGGKGTDGIKKLIDGVDKSLSKEDLARMEGKDGTLTALRAKIAKGEALTNADMHQLQYDVYQGLQDTKKAQMKAEGKDPDTATAGADPKTVETFLKNAPGFDKMMRENNMGISTVDMNGGGQAHAVLAVRNDDGKNVGVYDPYARKNGQMVTDQGSLMELQLAEKHREDGKPAFVQ